MGLFEGRSTSARKLGPEASQSLLMRAATGVDAVFGWLCQALVIGTTVILLAVLGANVVARYAFAQGGIEWISEVPEQLFPWMIAAGIVLAVQRGDHIAVDLIYKALSKRAALFLVLAILVLIIVAYAVLFVITWQTADIVSSQRSPLLGISGSWGYYALMFMAAGTALSSLTIMIKVMVRGVSALPAANPEDSPI
ncbi:MAG: TRAP transporter small permease [Ottowia sp.]|nr:TRAP transporter small permease [Ottowia sp.]